VPCILLGSPNGEPPSFDAKDIPFFRRVYTRTLSPKFQTMIFADHDAAGYLPIIDNSIGKAAPQTRQPAIRSKPRYLG
jgi:hypothetical protein